MYRAWSAAASADTSGVDIRSGAMWQASSPKCLHEYAAESPYLPRGAQSSPDCACKGHLLGSSHPCLTALRHMREPCLASCGWTPRSFPRLSRYEIWRRTGASHGSPTEWAATVSGSSRDRECNSAKIIRAIDTGSRQIVVSPKVIECK